MTKKAKKKNSSGRSFAIGAIFGAIAGGVAGVLTAPKSGKATRNDIKRGSKKAANDIKREGKKAATAVKKQVKKVTKGERTKKTSTKTRR